MQVLTVEVSMTAGGIIKELSARRGGKEPSKSLYDAPGLICSIFRTVRFLIPYPLL